MIQFDNSEIKRRLLSGEDSNWEFKKIEFRDDLPVKPKPDTIANELAAFANASGGIILFGVTNDGDVQDMTKEQLKQLEKLIVDISWDNITPRIELTTSKREIEGSRLLVVAVHKGYAAHKSKRGVYQRVGIKKRKLNADQILRLAQHRTQFRFLWFDRQIVSDTGFGTLEEPLWKPLLSSESISNPEMGLAKIALLAVDDVNEFRPTVAGILMCTKNPEIWLPSAYITATLYRGQDRASGQVDSKDIKGPLHQQVSEAVAFVIRNMRVAARKTPARVDLPQYSDKAVFEVIVNAVVHRDYSVRGSRIRIAMFSDRLEVQSPGALPNDLTVDSMAERQATRNEVLTTIFGRIRTGGISGSGDREFFVEKRGDGVPIIQAETKKLCGQMPKFRLIDNAEVLVSIPAASQDSSPGKVAISAYNSGRPLDNVNLLVLFPNNTWKEAVTDEEGLAHVELHSTHLPMTVFAAKKGYAASLEIEWVPAMRPLALNMTKLPNGGSVIFSEDTGYIPGLRGRLSPILDTIERTYLYASNIAINKGALQPVHFAINEELDLADSNGCKLRVKIVKMLGRSALLEYRSAS